MDYPIKIKIFFEGTFKLNVDATVFTILNLNKIQNLFEFEIYEIKNIFIKKKNKFFVTDFDNFVKKEEHLEKNSLFICITEQPILNNWFHATSKPYSIITLYEWDKHYSPPSYIEYIINSIIDCALHSLVGLDSHTETRGCCLDYTKYKRQLRWGIPLGHVCLNCKNEIIKKTNNLFYETITKIASLEWIGNPKDYNSVAYKLKKYYKFNINKDTGLEKTYWEKICEHLTEIPKELIVQIIITILIFFIGYLIGKN